jgi:hypothetical protein
VSKLIQALLLGIVGLVALVAAGPTITKTIQAATPLVLVLGVVAAVLRLVWSYTR